TLSRISANLFGHPSKGLTVIGITGTKGKTTTANYIRSILEEADINTGIIGTNGIFYNGKELDTINTTPESYELQRILRIMLDNGVKKVVLEVSSGGLMMERVGDIVFDIVVFSNISPDHIGPKEHPSFEHYLMTKSKLFNLSKHGIINIDDKYGNYMIENANCNIERFSMKSNADFQAIDIELSHSLEFLGSKFICKMGGNEYKFELSMPGTFNIYNALGAIAVCYNLGIGIKHMKTALRNIHVDGRVEVLPILDYASVIVDFAHNGVSLQNIISTLKEYKPKRMVCLIGSIGNRAQIRRKELGDIAAKECDITILTSDNPDYEDPMKIIDEMSQSFTDSDSIVIKEPDRERAIYKGIELLEEGDIFLIAGKGHERYNLI